MIISPLIIAKSQMEYVSMYRAFDQGTKARRIEKMIDKQIPIKIGDNIYHLLELKNTLKFKTIPGEKLFIRYYTKKEGEGIVMHPFEELGVFEEKIGRTLKAFFFFSFYFLHNCLIYSKKQINLKKI